MSENPCKVLICHSKNKTAEARKTKTVLETEGCEVRLLAIDSAQCTQERLETEIRWADEVLFLIDDELSAAAASGVAGGLAQGFAKRIVGVWSEDAVADSVLPKFLADHADAVVKNTPDTLVKGVTGEISKTVDSGGNPIPPRNLKRYTCR